jgi:hypothetical protein
VIKALWHILGGTEGNHENMSQSADCDLNFGLPKCEFLCNVLNRIYIS